MPRWSIVLLLAGTACTTSDTPRTGAVRDSLGIRIVENTAEQPIEVWTLEQPARVVIGGAGDPRQELFRVTGARLLSDGGIAVLNSGTYELRYYDAQGELRTTAGGRGEGPGEFARASALARFTGDSLIVWDDRLQRFTVFGPDAAFARIASLDRTVLNSSFAGTLAGNHIVISDFRMDVPERGFAMSSATLVLYDANGAFVDSLGRHPWMEVGIIAEGSVSRRIFAPITQVASTGDRVWIGTGEETSIDGYDAEGALRTIIRWTGSDRSVPPDAVARHLEARCVNAPAALCRAYHEIPVMPRFPAHEELRVDVEGNLWVQDFWQPSFGSTVPWRVFDRDNVLIARVDVPSTMRVLDIGADRVLGLVRDELGVETVVVHVLTRKAGAQ
jgi:hypothetical protein